MYPNLYYVFEDFFGVKIGFLRFINSFGFFVVIAFIPAAGSSLACCSSHTLVPGGKGAEATNNAKVMMVQVSNWCRRSGGFFSVILRLPAQAAISSGAIMATE